MHKLFGWECGRCHRGDWVHRLCCWAILGIWSHAVRRLLVWSVPSPSKQIIVRELRSWNVRCCYRVVELCELWIGYVPVVTWLNKLHRMCSRHCLDRRRFIGLFSVQSLLRGLVSAEYGVVAVQ